MVAIHISTICSAAGGRRMGIGSWAADQAKERARWAVMSEGQRKAYLQRQARIAALHEGEQIKQQYRAPVEFQ